MSEKLGKVDFYEIWVNENEFLAEIGIYGEGQTQIEATRIAKLINVKADAFFDRSGDIVAPQPNSYLVV